MAKCKMQKCKNRKRGKRKCCLNIGGVNKKKERRDLLLLQNLFCYFLFYKFSALFLLSEILGSFLHFRNFSILYSLLLTPYTLHTLYSLYFLVTPLFSRCFISLLLRFLHFSYLHYYTIHQATRFRISLLI